MKNREFNNKKGIQMIVKPLGLNEFGVRQFAKYKKTVQLVPDVFRNRDGFKVSKRTKSGKQKMKSIIHYVEC